MLNININADPRLPPIFKYETPKFPDDCVFNISPSQIYRFFDYPSDWYKECVLKEVSKFQGNTSTTIGIICHHVLEAITKKVPKDQYTKEIINAQLRDYTILRKEYKAEEIDIYNVMAHYPSILEVVVNEYLLKSNAKVNNILCEEKIVTKIADGIYVGGSLDRFEVDTGTIVDYKIVSQKPNDTEIPFQYKIQLLAYAYILKRLGYTVNAIKIVYGVKATKTIAPRCYEVSLQIGQQEENLINNTLQLIADSITICKKHPELVYLIFKDYNLK